MKQNAQKNFQHYFSIGSRSAVGGVPFVVDDYDVAGAPAVFASQLLLASLLFLSSMPSLASMLLLAFPPASKNDVSINAGIPAAAGDFCCCDACC